HPLEQVRGNPSRSVQTRQKLATDPEMCMIALTVSTAEPKNIKEAMANSAWIEAMTSDPPIARGIFINRAKYALEILHNHGMEKGQSIGLQYPKGSSFGLTAFSNADHAGCIDTRKSTSGGIQFLSDKLVSWMSKKQDCTIMSSAEAEYVALSASCAQVMWMRTQLQEYGLNYNNIPLYSDSQTEYQLADIFTKALPEDRFKYLVRRIGMGCLTPAELEVLTKEST
nr:copia protein [Tanacetum cinerariifolium]